MDAMGIVPTFDFQKIHSRHVFVVVCIPDVADHNLYRMMWKRYHTWRLVVGPRCLFEKPATYSLNDWDPKVQIFLGMMTFSSVQNTVYTSIQLLYIQLLYTTL